MYNFFFYFQYKGMNSPWNEHTVSISSIRGASAYLISCNTIKDELKVKYLQRNSIIIRIVHRKCVKSLIWFFFSQLYNYRIYTVMEYGYLRVISIDTFKCGGLSALKLFKLVCLSKCMYTKTVLRYFYECILVK